MPETVVVDIVRRIVRGLVMVAGFGRLATVQLFGGGFGVWQFCANAADGASTRASRSATVLVVT